MASQISDVLIVGAGAAGHSAATTLRQAGLTGTVRVVHEEPVPPYNRTLVDKGILPGLLTAEQAALPALGPLEVEMVNGRAVAFDAAEQALRLADGRDLRFHRLLVAVGSTPRSLAKGDLDGLFSLHRAQDALQIRAHVEGDFADRSVTVLGAGLVGTEAASFFVSAGATVHVVARSELPLKSSLGTPIATQLRDLHRQRTNFRGGRAVASLRRKAAGGIEICLDDGQRWESDLVISAQGTTPATSWIPSRGSGIPVDASLRAEGLPNVYAAGGAVLHSDGADGRTIRIDHWDDAAAQGAHAAWALLHDLGAGDDPGAYRAVTGYAVSMYGSSLTGAGVAGADASAHTKSGADGALVTTFTGRDGTVTGAVGWQASHEIHAIREELALRPHL